MQFMSICGWRQKLLLALTRPCNLDRSINCSINCSIAVIQPWNYEDTNQSHYSHYGYIVPKTVCVNVDVTDIILWQGHHDRVMQLNWLYFCGICQIMPLKVWPNTALGCNHQSVCMPQLQPLCSAALVPNVLPRRDEGSGQPCAVIEA